LPRSNTTKRTSLRDEQRTFTRSRLIHSATEVIRDLGYANTTVGDITDRAGASRATFYLHFKDKDELVEALIADVDQDVEDYYTRLDGVIATKDRATFRSWVVDARRWFVDNEATVVTLYQYAASRDVAANVGIRPYPVHMPIYTGATRSIERPQAEFRLWLAVEMVARANLVWRQYLTTSELSEEEMVDVLADSLWSLLRIDELKVPRHARERPA
jgi:AcrR family transcriptional regulator